MKDFRHDYRDDPEQLDRRRDGFWACVLAGAILWLVGIWLLEAL